MEILSCTDLKIIIVQTWRSIKVPDGAGMPSWEARRKKGLGMRASGKV